MSQQTRNILCLACYTSSLDPWVSLWGLVTFRVSQVQEISHHTAMQIPRHTGMEQGAQCRVGRLSLVSIDQGDFPLWGISSIWHHPVPGC